MRTEVTIEARTIGMQRGAENLRFCHNCGRDTDADSKFCKHCGSALNKSSHQGAQTKTTGNPAAILVAILVAVVLVGLIVVIALLSIRRGTADLSITSNSSPNSADGSTQQTIPSPSRSELTRETVSNLIKSRTTKNVDAAMPTMAMYPDTQRWQVYKQMVDANIIICPSRGYFGDFADCKPGPNGKQLRAQRNGTLTLPIGHKVPSVTGISRLDQTSGLAQVTLTFESSSGFEFF